MISKVLLGHGSKRLFATVSVALATSAGLLSSQALALSAGRIQVNSHLNEPFRATVKLSSLEPGESGQLKIRLADDASFAALGVEKSTFLTSLKFAVNELDEAGTALVSISSRQSAKEPFFSFLVEFEGLSGRLVREYTVLLDPNTGAARQIAQAQSEPTPTAAPRAQAALPVLPTAQSEAPAPAAAKIVAPSPQVFESNQPILRGLEVDQAGTDRYGPVKSGVTLWQIAAEVRPDPALSVNQVMWALYSQNPDQFNGNLNSLQRGAVLQVPDVAVMRDVSAREASALIAEEAKRYELQRTQATSEPALAPAAQSATAMPAMETVELEFEPETAPAIESDSALQDLAADDESLASDPELQDANLTGAEQPEQSAAIPEPEEAPVVVVDDLAVAEPEELPELPLEPEQQAMESQTDGDAMQASDDLASAEATGDLPSLPADDQAATGFDAGFSEQDSAASGNSFMTMILGLVGLLVIGVLIVLGLRRKSSQSKAPAAASVAPVVADSVSAARPVSVRETADTVTLEQTSQIPVSQPPVDGTQGLETLEVGDEAAAELHEETDFELPDLDTLAEQDAAAGMQAEDAEEGNAVDFGDTEISTAAEYQTEATSDLPAAASSDDLDNGNDVLDLGNDTVSLELNEDPISEADFQLAYGLYDEAALLLNRAIENDPERLELHEKLAETYFAAGNSDGFQTAASALKQHDPDPETWQRIAIMGQQMCPGDPLFAGDVADAAGALDMDFEIGEAPATEPDNSLEMSDEPVADNVLEFDLDDTGSAAEAAAEVVAEDQPSDDEFEPDFGSLELDAEAEEELADIGDLDLGDLEAELDADEEPENQAASAEPSLELDDEFSGDTVVMQAEDLEPASSAAASGEEPELAELTLSDVSNTDLGLDTAADLSEEIGSATEFELDTPDMDLESLELEDSSHQDQTNDNSIEFDMPELEIEPADVQVPSEPDDNALEFSLDSDDSTDDFNLDDLGEDLATATDFDLSDADADADFDLDSLELDSDSADKLGLDDDAGNDLELSLSDDESSDFDLSDLSDGTDFDLSDAADASEISGGDEAATKLDLARAYADMPDEKDMARNLLNEVLELGSEEQKAEAQQLLAQL